MTTDEASAAIVELVAINDYVVEIMEQMTSTMQLQSIAITLLTKRVEMLENT